MKKKFKCRPADPCYHADPYYTKEIEVDDYGFLKGLEAEAAAKFAEEVCSRRSEYIEEDVQVLTAAGWETFEIHIRSVPEFSASKKKGVSVEPEMVPCQSCDGSVGPVGSTTSTVCGKCQESLEEDD